MVLVVLFPLPDEKNVDVKTIFTCSQTCLLEMTLVAELLAFAAAASLAKCNQATRAAGWEPHPHARII